MARWGQKEPQDTLPASQSEQEHEGLGAVPHLRLTLGASLPAALI